MAPPENAIGICADEKPSIQALERAPVYGSDVSDLHDPTAGRYGEMVTLIGGEIGIDDVAAAIRSTGREVLSHLGSRFHRIYYAI
jgi:hypothetical protein